MSVRFRQGTPSLLFITANTKSVINLTAIFTTSLLFITAQFITSLLCMTAKINGFCYYDIFMELKAYLLLRFGHCGYDFVHAVNGIFISENCRCRL